MKQVTMQIDGQEVKAEEGMTLIQAASQAGIKIPALCYDDRLAPYGACRLCSVEIKKGDRSRIVAACAYPVEEGLVVETDTPRVQKIRKVILELLRSRSPGLKEELAERYKVDSARLDREPTYCILCGLCVRYCAEVKGANALGFVGRGTERQVVFFPEIAVKTCPPCKECFNICPTGVIPSDFAVNVPRFEKHPTVFPVRLRDEQNIRELLEKIE
ncbi:MAG TPA: 2Fe-2S iron-sulfur cluster binding domain-containing protein [Dehalococcoidia bacterium]|nr:2Fe-2S iron-sulfur cluster binding domain-containing protein [Dehalococcoidia bacterium]